MNAPRWWTRPKERELVVDFVMLGGMFLFFLYVTFRNPWGALPLWIMFGAIGVGVAVTKERARQPLWNVVMWFAIVAYILWVLRDAPGRFD